MATKRQYKREDLIRVTVFTYAFPVKLYPVSISKPYYKEGQILWSDKVKAFGYLDGFKVQYETKMYIFRKIDELRLPALWRYMRMNSSKYPGILSHANLYGGISKRLIKQVRLR